MNYYDQIKGLFISNEIYKRVKDYSKNKNNLETYYNVDKLIIEAQGGEKRAKSGKLLQEAGKAYGKNIIKQYSEKLMIEVGKKYNYRTLYRMRKFYEIFSNEKLTIMWSKLTWSILEKFYH